MVRKHITVSGDASPAQRAHEMMALEVASPGTTLLREGWRTRHDIERLVKARLSGRVLPGEVETALDLLVERGLVAEQSLEGELSVRCPQRYRWSKWATAEVLRWRVERVKPPACRVCGGPLPLSVQRVETCSNACRKRAWNERGSLKRRMQGACV